MGSLRGLRSGGRAIPVCSILTVAVLAGSCLTGCRSGSSGTTPSWSMFGGSAKDSGKLASAPPFEGDLTKPSTTAKPYPTTSTPEGYVLATATGQNGAADGASPGPAAAADAIVYGSTPPPATAAVPASAGPGGYRAATPPPASSIAGVDTPISSIVPQVGPYAASTPATPAAVETASAPSPVNPAPPAASAAFAAGPAASAAGPAAFATNPSGIDTPPARVADARGATGWDTAGDAAAPAAFDSADRYVGESRYGAGSRFASAPPPAGATPATTPPATGFSAPAGTPADRAQPPVGWPASAAPASPFGSPPGMTPQPPLAPAAGPAPMVSPPATAPGPTALPGGPVRRPDPGFRPGGTSSYQRGGDQDVVPASFDGAGPPAQP